MARKNILTDDLLEVLPANDEIKRGVGRHHQAEKLTGRKRQDQSEFMSKHNPMLGKVSPNRGKAMPNIAEKITGIKRTAETRRKISDTRKRLGLGNSWSGVERPEHSLAMRDPKRNKGAETMRESRTCPHCNKVANVPNYKRWHGDNCKHK